MSARRVAALAVLLVVSVVAYLLACSHAAWSPDGKSIAFASHFGDKGQRHLYVAPADGGKARLLWAAESYLSAPGWSPDGKHLAVVHVAPAVVNEGDDTADWPVAVATGSKTRSPLTDGLYVVSVADGTRRLVARQNYLGPAKLATEDWGLVEPQPQWTGGGKTLLWPIQELRQVRLLDAGSGKLIRQLDRAMAPVVSPSGKHLAMLVMATEEKTEIHVFDLETITQRRLVAMDDSEGRAPPAWSPDSSRLIFYGAVARETQPDAKDAPADDGKKHVWQVAVSDAALRRVAVEKEAEAQGCGEPVRFDWSPKGDLVAMAAGIEGGKGRGGKFGVWLMKPDGSGLKRIDQAKGEDMALHPTFSPDGSKLSFRLVKDKDGDDNVVHTAIYDVAAGTSAVIPIQVPVPKKEGGEPKP